MITAKELEAVKVGDTFNTGIPLFKGFPGVEFMIEGKAVKHVTDADRKHDADGMRGLKVDLTFRGVRLSTMIFIVKQGQVGIRYPAKVARP